MPSQSTAETRRAKLDQLIELEGCAGLDELLEAAALDSVSPAICTNDGCNYTAEMEPDQEQGYCEVLRHQHGCLGTRFGRPHLMSAERIRELNDRFRTTMTGGRVLMTAGVNALSSDVKAMVIRRVATFSEFTADNDPHEEHDFGNFELAGRKLFFKIDYFDANMEFGSEDPADPAKTTRALTIMLAEEY